MLLAFLIEIEVMFLVLEYNFLYSYFKKEEAISHDKVRKTNNRNAKRYLDEKLYIKSSFAYANAHLHH